MYPVFSTSLFLLILGTTSFPGTLNFIGELFNMISLSIVDVVFNGLFVTSIPLTTSYRSIVPQRINYQISPRHCLTNKLSVDTIYSLERNSSQILLRCVKNATQEAGTIWTIDICFPITYSLPFITMEVSGLIGLVISLLLLFGFDLLFKAWFGFDLLFKANKLIPRENYIAGKVGGDVHWR